MRFGEVNWTFGATVGLQGEKISRNSNREVMTPLGRWVVEGGCVYSFITVISGKTCPNPLFFLSLSRGEEGLRRTCDMISVSGKLLQLVLLEEIQSFFVIQLLLIYTQEAARNGHRAMVPTNAYSIGERKGSPQTFLDVGCAVRQGRSNMTYRLGKR